MNKDRLTKERRSWNMSRIRGKNTAPEKIVRSFLHHANKSARMVAQQHESNAREEARQ